jgi:DNA replication ATP-dependent helicase Dna2
LVRFYERHIIKGEELEVERYKRTYLKIEKIVSSEYMFRSNFFGLKGKVDLLLAGQLIDKRNNKSEQVYIPMELKTGKRVSDSHKRQTDIYNILVR